MGEEKAADPEKKVLRSGVPVDLLRLIIHLVLVAAVTWVTTHHIARTPWAVTHQPVLMTPTLSHSWCKSSWGHCAWNDVGFTPPDSRM